MVLIMINNMKKIIFIISVLFAIVFVINSCYYDNEEDLYKYTVTPCDTTNITYSAKIAPLLQSQCSGCHSTSSASAGIAMDNYTSLKVIIDNGKFWGAINQSSGYSPMPKGGMKMTDCNLTIIKIWLDAKAPNN
jgi:hypothetical protein